MNYQSHNKMNALENGTVVFILLSHSISLIRALAGAQCTQGNIVENIWKSMNCFKMAPSARCVHRSTINIYSIELTTCDVDFFFVCCVHSSALFVWVCLIWFGGFVCSSRFHRNVRDISLFAVHVKRARPFANEMGEKWNRIRRKCKRNAKVVFAHVLVAAASVAICFMAGVTDRFRRPAKCETARMQI